MQSSVLSANEARIAELVHAYLAAEYRWELGGEWLNLHPGEPAIALVRRFPEASRFGLLTAWNPHSIERPVEVNHAADETLQAALLDSGRVFRPAFASAANRSWREPGWLVVNLPPAEFDALSQRFGQLATLYWCASGPVRMRIDAARPQAFDRHPDLDWLRD